MIKCMLGKTKNEWMCEPAECKKCSWNEENDKRLTRILKTRGLQKDAKGIMRLGA